MICRLSDCSRKVLASGFCRYHYYKNRANVSFGKSYSREYRIWQMMKQRCENPNNCNYKRYGARGISVCERWNDFANFLEDMGVSPSLTHSIERVDNNGNYTSENCHWATPKQQQNNTSMTRRFTMEGITRSVTQWAEFYGVSPGLVYNRLKRNWSIEKALLEPVGNNGS